MKPTDSEPVYTIGVVSSRFGISPETLRLYEREGLLIPHRTDTGRRLYSNVDLDWIECIRELITVKGLNISGIRHLLALIPCWELKPCTEEDRSNCVAYKSNDQVCWNLEVTGATCQNEDCYMCEIYHMAGNAGKMKQFLNLSPKTEEDDKNTPS